MVSGRFHQKGSEILKKNMMILLALLLLFSVTFNVILFNSSQKYKNGVDLSLDYHVSNYKVGAIHRTLYHSLTEGKIYVGQEGALFNYLQRDFQQLSNVHRELTFLYGTLFSYDNNISSFGTNNLFTMFQDFYVFFEYLVDNNSDTIVEETDGIYMILTDLDQETLTGVQIITDITGELQEIFDESYQNKQSSNHDAFKTFMERCAEYTQSPDVQVKVKELQKINRAFIEQSKK